MKLLTIALLASLATPAQATPISGTCRFYQGDQNIYETPCEVEAGANRIISISWQGENRGGALTTLTQGVGGWLSKPSSSCLYREQARVCLE